MLVSEIPIEHRGQQKLLQLIVGDITAPTHAPVDLIVVSAFANDYLPTPSSIIGALSKVGISVAALAQSKTIDLREQYSCWLSTLPQSPLSYKHLLCIESGWNGSPPEIVTDLFRSLYPIVLGEPSIRSVAVPLLGAGDQGWPADVMLNRIAREAISWMRKGLPLDVFQIFCRSAPTHETIEKISLYARSGLQSHDRLQIDTPSEFSLPILPMKIDNDYSELSYSISPSISPRKQFVFISYSHDDTEYAEIAKNIMERHGVGVFFDKSNLRTGGQWLLDLANNLDKATRVLSLYSPNYWKSKFCQLEFSATLMRQIDCGQNILFPVYLKETDIPWMFQTVQFHDCRISDTAKLTEACEHLTREILAN